MNHLVVAALLVASLVACTSDSGGTAVCEAGLQRQCPCVGGGSGVQRCATDGSAWGVCEGCGTPSADVAPDVPEASTDPDDAPDAEDDSDAEVTSGNPGVGQTCEPCGLGSLRGIVCAPSEQVFVSGATLTIEALDCDGQPVTVEATSKPDGTYEMSGVPCGEHTVRVQAGAFTNSYPVTIRAGEETDITGVGKKLCFHAQSATIGVWWGQWDDQQDLLDQLGFEYVLYDFSFDFFGDTHPDDIEAVQVLRDYEKLSAFRILFFNCGSAALQYVHAFPEISDNLRKFVLEGGSIYASDLSWAYVEGAFPEAFDFLGDDDLPQTPGDDDGPQQVEGHQEVPATIVDADMAAYVGTSVFTANYGSGPLIAIQEAGPGAVAHVIGPVTLDDGTTFAEGTTHVGPFVTSYRPGGDAGAVVYTTFHNDEQADEIMSKVLYYLVFLL